MASLQRSTFPFCLPVSLADLVSLITTPPFPVKVDFLCIATRDRQCNEARCSSVRGAVGGLGVRCSLPKNAVQVGHVGTQKVENSPPKMTKGSSSAFAIGVAAVEYASLLQATFAQGQGNICAAIQPILPSECTPSADCFQVNCNIGIG